MREVVRELRTGLQRTSCIKGVLDEGEDATIWLDGGWMVERLLSEHHLDRVVIRNEIDFLVTGYPGC
jgi:hypothetical protein